MCEMCTFWGKEGPCRRGLSGAGAKLRPLGEVLAACAPYVVVAAQREAGRAFPNGPCAAAAEGRPCVVAAVYIQQHRCVRVILNGCNMPWYIYYMNIYIVKCFIKI